MKRLLLSLLVVVIIATSFSPKQITWIAIGDSITYLNDHKDETGNRVAKGYMTRVVERLPYMNYINEGHNGWTSGRMASEIEKLKLVKADVYTIFLGTNDWWRSRTLGTLDDYRSDTSKTTVFGSFRTIINKVRSLNKKARIILITPMQRGDFVYLNNTKNTAYGSYREKNGRSLAQFANAVVSIGQYENITVVDLYNKSGITQENMVKFKRLKDPATGEYKNYKYPDFIDVPYDPETDEYPYPIDAIDMTYDGLHPSDKGYDIIANMIMEAIKRK